MNFIKASEEHTRLLYEWANEAETRKNAFHTDQIPYSTHVEWFSHKLADPNSIIYICKENELEIGQLRLDVEEAKAVISYSIAKEHRGKGYGTELIGKAEELIKGNPSMGKVKCLIGKVKYENIGSQKCFEKNSFIKYDFPKYIEYRKKIR